MAISAAKCSSCLLSKSLPVWSRPTDSKSHIFDRFFRTARVQACSVDGLLDRKWLLPSPQTKVRFSQKAFQRLWSYLHYLNGVFFPLSILHKVFLFLEHPAKVLQIFRIFVIGANCQDLRMRGLDCCSER